ncbi:MAG: hypothetical protein KDD43_16280, partial [Bdellovibrionales bacterium]|nr:hypothetical protein [Bdellovibrionales bacterium]
MPTPKPDDFERKVKSEVCQLRSKGLLTQVEALCDQMKKGALILMTSKFNEKCQAFIDENGQLGEWGVQVLKTIAMVDEDCFYKQMNVVGLCPRFSQMKPEDKSKFWVYVFASIAQKESSCDPSVYASGSYGRADGLFQLEHSYVLRRGSGRDADLCRTRGPTDTLDVTFQIECAVSIFRDIHCKMNRPIEYRGGYWERLRGQRR